MVRNRNTTLELLKLLAAYMVVFVHVRFPGAFGDVAKVLARFAVPFFLVATGFYSYQISLDKIKKRIFHILRLTLLTVCIYTLYKIASFLLDSDISGLYQHFRDYLNLESIIKFLAFNIPFHAPFMWYLFAILYVYIVFYIVTIRKLKDKHLFAVSFALLSINLLLGEGLSVFGITVTHFITRNFLFTGIPFFGIGLFASKHKQKLAQIPGFMIPLCLIIGLLATLLSYMLLGTHELYLGSVLTVLGLMLIFIKHAQIQYPPVLTLLTGCSTYVYILHTMVSPVVKRVYPLIGIDYESLPWLHMVHPLLICILSTVLAYGLNKLAQKLHI